MVLVGGRSSGQMTYHESRLKYNTVYDSGITFGGRAVAPHLFVKTRTPSFLVLWGALIFYERCGGYVFSISC